MLINNHIYFVEGIIFEDYLWSYQLMDVAQKVLVLPQVTYYYRPNANSIMHSRQLKIGKTIYCWDVIFNNHAQAGAQYSGMSVGQCLLPIVGDTIYDRSAWLL